MGGDGLGGLAAAIGVAMVALLALGAAVGWGVGAAVGRARGADRARTRRIAVVAAVAGLGLGALAVVATFFESTFAPPPRLDLVAPPGYAREWTVVLEDPRAAGGLAWSGGGLPFAQRRATLAVPPSGVVRVRSLGDAQGRGDLDVRWSDGAVSNGTGGGPAPAATGATGYLAVNRMPADATGPGETLSSEDGAFAAWIAERERSR